MTIFCQCQSAHSSFQHPVGQTIGVCYCWSHVVWLLVISHLLHIGKVSSWEEVPLAMKHLCWGRNYLSWLHSQPGVQIAQSEENMWSVSQRAGPLRKEKTVYSQKVVVNTVKTESDNPAKPCNLLLPLTWSAIILEHRKVTWDQCSHFKERAYTPSSALSTLLEFLAPYKQLQAPSVGHRWVHLCKSFTQHALLCIPQEKDAEELITWRKTEKEQYRALNSDAASQTCRYSQMSKNIPLPKWALQTTALQVTF